MERGFLLVYDNGEILYRHNTQTKFRWRAQQFAWCQFYWRNDENDGSLGEKKSKDL